MRPSFAHSLRIYGWRLDDCLSVVRLTFGIFFFSLVHLWHWVFGLRNTSVVGAVHPNLMMRPGCGPARYAVMSLYHLVRRGFFDDARMLTC